HRRDSDHEEQREGVRATALGFLRRRWTQKSAENPCGLTADCDDTRPHGRACSRNVGVHSCSHVQKPCQRQTLTMNSNRERQYPLASREAERVAATRYGLVSRK